MSSVLDVIWHGLRDAFLMAWEVWWALVFGFFISAVVQAWVPRRAHRERPRRRRRCGRSPSPPGLGAASSSCSYAAIAIAKSLFQKGASAASALAFQFASTNLVWELGLVLWVLIGWQFTLAEYLGGIVMIVLMALLLRVFVSRRLEEQAREHAQARRHRPPAPRGRRADDLARAADQRVGVVGRRAQLPRRLADAVEGDHARLPARRVRRPARQRLLQRPVPQGLARSRADASGARSSARSSPCSASSARSATCRWPRCCGAAASASPA